MTIAKATVADYRALHRIADALEPRLRRAFLDTVRQLRNDLDVGRLVELLRQGDQGQLGAFWQAVETQLGAAVAPSVRLGILSAGMRAGGSLGIRFDLTNPLAVRAIDEQVVTLVRGITGESQRAIRTILRRGFLEGRTVEQMARDIRAHVGLTERDAIALANYRAAQQAAEVLPGLVQERTDRYAAQLLRRRATVISRTETIRAANLGQQAAWMQARRDGLVNPSAKRVWIITPDDRLCPECEAIADRHPDGVGMDESFQGPEGPVFTPPAHPQCRCAVGLEFPEDMS